jgi:hypothetical protein
LRLETVALSPAGTSWNTPTTLGIQRASALPLAL